MLVVIDDRNETACLIGINDGDDNQLGWLVSTIAMTVADWLDYRDNTDW